MTDCAENEPWYKDGLRFKCTGCGKCCTGSPGYVWVTEDEIVKMSEFLGIGVDEFVKKYIRQRFDRYALIEMKAKNYDCVFLKDNMCLVYAARPLQCRTFPWWKENLTSEQSWKQTAEGCEGINDEAPLIPCTLIEQELQKS
jgi:uncharacterized protein